MHVRRLPLGVAVSTAVHAVAVVWIGTRVFPPRATAEAAAATPIEIIAADRPPVAPVEPVTPLDLAITGKAAAPVGSSPPPPGPRPRSPGRPAPDEAAIVVPGAGSAAETAPPPARGSLMAMRRGDVPRPVLPSGRWDDLDHVPRGTTPEKDQTTGILHDSGRGTLESDQGVFVGRVNPDGSVKLRDRPNLNVHLRLPTPKDLGRTLAGWYESDKGAYGRAGDTAMAKQIQVTSGPTTDPEDPAKPEHQLKDMATTVIVPVIGGGFDTTDWLMHRHGEDPYARRKLALLDATRDERVQRGNQHRARQLALTPQIVHRTLEALWSSRLDMRARKQALFELWDECVETGDPALVAGGQAARRLVIGFIRAHVPAGGADAFTDAELAAFARVKQSAAAFVPYE